MLENIVRAFLRGLNNQEIRKEAARGMTSADRSLRNVYALAEEARRTNLEIQKSLNEDTKSRELRFYKSHFELNVPKHQVASLFAFFREIEEKSPQDSWFYRQKLPRQPEEQRPSYRSEAPALKTAVAPPVLARNPNKANAGRSNSINQNGRFRNFQPTPKATPARTESNNYWINGSKLWSMDKDGRYKLLFHQ